MNERVLNGWRVDLENRDELHAMCDSMIQMSAYRGTFAAPAVVDPRPWLRVENQGSIGSCQGNALSTCHEIAYKIATGDTSFQSSRRAAYIWSQRVDNIRGDQGSTLSAGMKVVQEMGLPTEATVPYFTAGYTAKIPNEEKAKQEAQQYKIRKSVRMKSAQDVYDWLAAGFGGVQIGIMWPDSWMDPPAGKPLPSFRPGGGGHSTAIVGYLSENEFINANSWGEQWCDGGYGIVLRKDVDAFIRHRFSEVIAHTDMSVPEPRTWDLPNWDLVPK